MQTTTQNPFSGLEGFVEENAPLARHTWYKIGGPARYLIAPRSVEQLQQASRRCVENGIPVYVLGFGANLLISDSGVDGAVFRFSDDYWKQSDLQGNVLKCGSGVDLAKMLVTTARAGLAGIETLAGIPGTVGGGVRMNCGGKFGDIGSVVTHVTVMDLHGEVFVRTKDDLVFDYRQTNIAAPFILDATFELERDDPAHITARTKEIWMFKRNSQPLTTKNCGCIFKNPRGISAGALIDQTGLKGTAIGGAQVSDKHANFIIAHPGCRSADVLELIALIKNRVYEKNGVMLESEVRVWPI